MSPEAFRDFGDVITSHGRSPRLINAGTSQRFDDVAIPDLAESMGRAAIHLFRTEGRTLPVHVDVMERHPLGSQAFQPLAAIRSLVVVAHGQPEDGAIHAFLTAPGQGWNLKRGIWHAPLIMLGPCEVLVIERAPASDNLDLMTLSSPIEITL